jgi:hypothetical protein
VYKKIYLILNPYNPVVSTCYNFKTHLLKLHLHKGSLVSISLRKTTIAPNRSATSIHNFAILKNVFFDVQRRNTFYKNRKNPKRQIQRSYSRASQRIVPDVPPVVSTKSSRFATQSLHKESSAVRR